MVSELNARSSSFPSPFCRSREQSEGVNNIGPTFRLTWTMVFERLPLVAKVAVGAFRHTIFRSMQRGCFDRGQPRRSRAASDNVDPLALVLKVPSGQSGSGKLIASSPAKGPVFSGLREKSSPQDALSHEELRTEVSLGAARSLRPREYFFRLL